MEGTGYMGAVIFAAQQYICFQCLLPRLASPASSFASLKFKIVTEGSCSSYECPNYQKVERERVLKAVLK